MISRPQELHADLGLIDDDNTEEMRKPPAIDTVFQHRAAEGFQNQPITRKAVHQ